MSEPKYSPEVIRRYRERDGARGFHREIVEHQPITLSRDRLRLACGHEQEDNYAFCEALHKFEQKTGSPSARCEQCVQAWLRQAIREEGVKP
jgi:hypothetical protein